MISRLLNAALAATFALLLTIPPTASAAPTASERAETYAKIRAMKRQMIMQKAQQRMLKARLHANPKKKLPKGYAIIPSRTREAGSELAARVKDLEARGVLIPGRGVAPGALVEGRVQGAGDFGPNHRVNDPTTDLFADAGQSETSIAAHGNNVLLTWNDGDGFDRAGPPT
ncbi:MAG TPA: hypothetical protein VF414_05180 [Thermoanaerobaculia bacterium]